ncbi:pectate lyase c [Fusarium avenaceum]|nr:pectate lyase c [Fusarium avenaceum]
MRMKGRLYAIKFHPQFLSDNFEPNYDNVYDGKNRPYSFCHPFDWHFSPFDNEARAFGRLQEMGCQHLAVKAHGYTCLTVADIDNKLQSSDSDLRMSQFEDGPYSDAIHLHGIVKDWVEMAEHPDENKRERWDWISQEPKFPRMLEDLHELHRIGIVLRDVSARQYVNGILVDLSLAATVPHPYGPKDPNAFGTGGAYSPRWTFQSLAAFDLLAFQTHIIESWNSASASVTPPHIAPKVCTLRAYPPKEHYEYQKNMQMGPHLPLLNHYNTSLLMIQGPRHDPLDFLANRTAPAESSREGVRTIERSTLRSAVPADRIEGGEHCYVLATLAAQLAFPGAEGFGRNAVGGRQGEVYKVTNLNDSGEGSLRDAVSKSNRIVVFDVGGVIKISERIVVSKNTYIAGQTAPGGGIVVYGNGWSLSNANESIVRYITIRMGKGGTSGKDAIGIADGKNIIFDHVSVSWGRDETFSINGDVTNVTIQDSIIAQGLVSHSCGGLMQTDGGVSLFRNLYIDNKTRNPKVKGVNDFQNNVVYNWGAGGGYIAGDSQADSYANVINNYFISGPDTSVTAFTRGNKYFHGYVKNNFYDSNRNGKLDGAALCESTTCYSDMDIVKTPYAYPAPSSLTAQQAVEVVLKGVGNSLHRDAVDTALIKQVKSYGTEGKQISDEKEFGGVGEIAAGTALKDSDGDGIPDEWEIKNGLNPQDASDGMKIASNGYANLENYVNSLV